MARMPTRDDLPQGVAQANTNIVRAPQDTLGTSMRGLGDTLAGVSRVLHRQAEEDRKKQAVMEKARATAFLTQALMEGESRYTLENKPDEGKWGDDFAKGSQKWREEAAKMISDPNERELFTLQAQDDITRYSMSVTKRAQEITNKKWTETLNLSMNQLVDQAAMTDDEEERARLFGKIRDLGKEGVSKGLWSPAYMADFDVKARQKVAGLRVEQKIMTDPGVAFGALSGRPTEGYVNKLYNAENARRDPKARPRGPDGELLSSALGLFQFTHETWERMREQYPKLGLTKSYGKVDNPNDGRLDKDQQIRAMNKLTELNAKGLRDNGFVPSEANLYLAHFAGLQGAIDLLSADPTAPADRLFPKMAEKNMRHFSGKTVEGAIASLTKNFNAQPIEVGPEYASLSPEQRIALTRQAKAAADQQWSQGKDEWETEMVSQIADDTESFQTREEALEYVRNADGSADVRLKAEQLVNQRWNTKDKVKEENRQAQWQQTYKAVQDGMDRGADPVELNRLADSVTDQNDRAALKKYIADGPPKSDNLQLMNRIDSMRYSADPAMQKKFIEMDLTTPEMLAGLTSERRGQLFAQQQEAKKSQLPNGSAPQLTTMASIRDSYPVQLGLTVKGKDADAEDIATWSVIEGDIQQRLDLFYQTNKRPPNQTEVRDIADDAIIQWHQSVKTGGIGGWWQNDTATAKAVSDAYEALPAKDKQPLSAMWQRYVADLQAHNQQTGKNLQPSPTFFMENYLK